MDHFYEDKKIEISNVLDFSDSEFINCTFENQDLQNFNLINVKFRECRFLKCNLSNVKLNGARLSDVKFKDCKAIGVNWCATSQLLDISFSHTLLNYSIFQGMNLTHLKIQNSQCQEVDFSGSNLQKADLSNCNFEGASFNEADLREADLRNSTGYFIDPTFTKLKGAKLSLPEAVEIIRALGIIVN